MGCPAQQTPEPSSARSFAPSRGHCAHPSCKNQHLKRRPAPSPARLPHDLLAPLPLAHAQQDGTSPSISPIGTPSDRTSNASLGVASTMATSAGAVCPSDLASPRPPPLGRLCLWTPSRLRHLFKQLAQRQFLPPFQYSSLEFSQ
ncbi:unnamed protein product [Ilex paraguariensis]|uniref:Uncharacterized protein n=1 Tax=Ilex paraguariensis TaxID=185542 RepID=A0ABC8TAK7_9AQUA